MARGVERAAAYVPPASIDGRRVAASDEDGFTLAATALERLESHASEIPLSSRLVLVGDLPSSAEADIPRFLGYPIVTERLGSGPGALRQALRSATTGAAEAPPVLLVAVDLGSGAPDALDGAVAVRISSGDDRDTGLADDPMLSDGSLPAAALLRAGAKRGVETPSRWVGDFTQHGATSSIAPGARSVVPPDGPVSQGAYVPRPRYLENLGSRWRFVGERCRSCGKVGFPPRGRCRACGAVEGLEPFSLPRDGGEVVAATTIGPGGQPTEFDEQVALSGPYSVVLVDLIPGVRVTLQVADRPTPIAIGSRVATRLRRLYPMEGEWRYGRKAVPLA
jgi:uncharacterized protein